MIPVSPDITLRPLRDDDADKIAHLLNRAIMEAPYSGIYTAEIVRAQLRREMPDTIAQVKWHRTLRIGAWRAGKLIGLLDAGTGIPPDEENEPALVENRVIPNELDDRPFYGLLRMLILPEREDLLDGVAHQLLQRAETFWQEAGVEKAYAFKVGVGYRLFQAGSGVLPGTWSEQFRLLTSNGYQLEQRYRALVRSVDRFVEEVFPTANISLASHILDDGWETILYHRRIQRIAYMRVFTADLVSNGQLHMQSQGDEDLLSQGDIMTVAVMTQLHISSEWRENDLGRLLVRRLINDAYHRGFQEVVVYLSQSQHVAWSLLVQQGFQELSYNGYSFVKTL